MLLQVVSMVLEVSWGLRVICTSLLSLLWCECKLPTGIVSVYLWLLSHDVVLPTISGQARSSSNCRRRGAGGMVEATWRRRSRTSLRECGTTI